MIDCIIFYGTPNDWSCHGSVPQHSGCESLTHSTVLNLCSLVRLQIKKRPVFSPVFISACTSLKAQKFIFQAGLLHCFLV